MENNKQRNKILICLICLFALSLSGTIFVGFSGNLEQSNVKVKSVTPEYDESSTITMNGNDVKFNDKDQEVKYKVVLENTEGHNLTVSSVDLTTPTESFLSYTIENLKKDDVINANSTKEVTVTLKTTATEGWGRNFNDELTANITFAKNLGTGSTDGNIANPNTGDKILFYILIGVTGLTGIAIVIVSKKKFIKYMVLTLMLSPALTLVKADTTIELPITLNVSFESQNVMKANDGSGYWQVAGRIKKFYISNEISELEGVVDSFDMSESQKGRVMAYLVENANDSSDYDVHLQADGIIYANTNASGYFGGMSLLDSIVNIEGLDVSNVINMRMMFFYTGSSSSNFTLDLGDNFDTSNVTDMSYMFSNLGEFSDTIILNLGDKFDTSNVTDMSAMFLRAGDNSDQFVLELGNKFDTSNVTNMSSMFECAGSLKTSITIRNPRVLDFRFMFLESAIRTGAQVTVNYTSKTSSLVDKMIATSTGANVVKGELVEIITDYIDVGDEIAIADEHFNVISQTDDTVTMLAKYNLGTDHKQSEESNYVIFSESSGWDYRPAPQEIDIQRWAPNIYELVNAYEIYLKSQFVNDNFLTGNLITVNELVDLGCVVKDGYELLEGGTCVNSSNKGWLINGQTWWTRSASSVISLNVGLVGDSGSISSANCDWDYQARGVRPVITLSKDALKNLG